MKKAIISILLCMSLHPAFSQWAPAGDKIKTRWTGTVTPENVWKEYPRPQLKRDAWQNLNGLWKYQITDMDTKKNRVKFEGEILVPFAIESSLSGVMKPFLPTDKLWYRKEFTIIPDWKGRNIILHFGAVDYECHVWINDKLAGSHKGGNNSFSFDITDYVKGRGTQVLEMCVTDPTDTESITRGKQQLNQRGIWYTPVSGIWQTVWLEAVNKTHINKVLPEADITGNTVKLSFDIAGKKGNERLKINVLDNGKTISQQDVKIADQVEIRLPQVTLWTPESPVLYDLEISLYRDNREIDKVKSYFAMREISGRKDEAGYNRICLNNEPVFQYGTLDQGWWPDGLLTPPSAEAMRWDMVQLKEMGFNTLRKHIKVENALYYYYADSLGLMIWQDMPSGFATSRAGEEHIRRFAKSDWNAPEAHAVQFEKELDEMIDNLRFFPSITTWVVFNEGWGQQNTVEVVRKVMQKDSSRLINGVSGWEDRNIGDMYDLHNYPCTSMTLPENNNDRISVLGEFGGLGLPVKGSLWNPEMRNWGYKNIDGGVDLLSDYSYLMYDLETLIAQGLSAAIYTQTTDVEGEVNGLITYDRKVTKLPKNMLHMLHSRLYGITPAKADVLIRDAQGGKKNEKELSIDGRLQTAVMPCTIEGKPEVYSVHEFTTDKDYKNLSLFMNVNGQVTIRINGQEVFDRNVREAYKHQQFNLSDYATCLKKGKNIFEIRVKPNRTINFDYGLRAF